MGQIQFQEEETMYRRGLKQVVGILVVVALAMVARGVSANGSKTSATIDILTAASLNGKQLKPGTYTVTVDDTKVTVAQNGKVMAEAPVEWKDESKKPSNSNVVINNDEVKEIHFGGKMRYVTVAPVEGKL
jgi:outer membrane lipoprotein-sorting protein